MILFTNNNLFTMSVYDGNGRKTQKYTGFLYMWIFKIFNKSGLENGLR